MSQITDEIRQEDIPTLTVQERFIEYINSHDLLFSTSTANLIDRFNTVISPHEKIPRSTAYYIIKKIRDSKHNIDTS